MQIKKSKTIVFNSWSGAFFNKGGGEVQLLNSKRGLEKRGHQVLPFNQWEPQRRFDVFHSFSTEPGTEHVVRGYHEMNIPIAVSPIMWTLPPLDSFRGWQTKYILDRTQVIMTNSDAESQRLAQHFGISIEKFHKTRNAITDDFLALGNPELFQDQTKIKGDFVLSVANIDQRKDTKTLIEACRKIDVPLVVIGAIRDPDYFNDFKDSWKHFHHLGPSSDIEFIKSALSACRLFALPSHCETPGISALEAASQNCPIVITQEGCTKEYFGETAHYVIPGNIESVTQGIVRALNGPQKQVHSKNLFATWDDVAVEIELGYQKILNSGALK